MIFKFRSRIFLYLLGLLALFVASQMTIYLVVEWLHWTSSPYENVWGGLKEVAEAMGMTLLLLIPWAVAAWWISRRMIRPLHAVAETAGRIRTGQWSERIETAAMPDDETKSLAETVNAAFDGYTAVLRRLERFSGDAAHQLRTPIAAMRSLGEVSLSRPRTAEEFRETLETMLAELDRLTRIVEQLLQLSRLESSVLRERFVSVSVGAVVERVQQIYQPLAEANGVQLDVQAVPSELRVDGIEELVVELLGNLTDNALRYTPAGGSIRIQRVSTSEGDICLSVTDSGPGIPQEYAQRIFDRFTQVPGVEPGAAGLGLSLAAEIAAVHGGRLALTNPGKPGACFECRLPVSKA
jgi:signal transduction histidine kinase